MLGKLTSQTHSVSYIFYHKKTLFSSQILLFYMCILNKINENYFLKVRVFTEIVNFLFFLLFCMEIFSTICYNVGCDRCALRTRYHRLTKIFIFIGGKQNGKEVLLSLLRG